MEVVKRPTRVEKKRHNRICRKQREGVLMRERERKRKSLPTVRFYFSFFYKENVKGIKN